MLLTDRQTDRQTNATKNIISSAEIMNASYKVMNDSFFTVCYNGCSQHLQGFLHYHFTKSYAGAIM